MNGEICQVSRAVEGERVRRRTSEESRQQEKEKKEAVEVWSSTISSMPFKVKVFSLTQNLLVWGSKKKKDDHEEFGQDVCRGWLKFI